MNLQNICDILQGICLLLLSVTVMSQTWRINELEETTGNLIKTILITRNEMDLPLLPLDPGEKDEA